MNHDRSLTLAPRSVRMTGSALVITRLSRVAMNIGRLTAAITSHSGARRASVRRVVPSAVPWAVPWADACADDSAGGSTGALLSADIASSNKLASNDY